MRQGPEFFGEQELVLLFVARKLKEALELEDLLTRGQMDYLVEPDKYSGGIIFRSERIGAFFYVSEKDQPAARELLRRHRITPYDLGNDSASTKE